MNIDRIEHLSQLHSHCVALAHALAFDPYRTRDAEFWLSHAEELDARINDLIDDELAHDAADTCPAIMYGAESHCGCDQCAARTMRVRG